MRNNELKLANEWVSSIETFAEMDIKSYIMELILPNYWIVGLV